MFEARAMLAEVVAEQYPAVAEALLDGVLDGDRFFVVSSTLRAFAADGRDAAEVASVERRLVELARVMPEARVARGGWAAARVLTTAARKGLEEQWRMAARCPRWRRPAATRCWSGRARRGAVDGREQSGRPGTG